MDKIDLQKLIDEYKNTLKKNIPSIDKYIKSIKSTQVKTFQKYGYKPKYKLHNNFRLYIQPIELWTYDDVSKAKKVIEFYKNAKLKYNNNEYRYKKPMFPISDKKSYLKYIKRFKNI